ncbi:MAG: family hydrolase [Gammaproteobacteria bacterium]|jgi:phosphoglycolate phosphatase|nr:family hydrolase [Gammaproteobacteria bacterium]
MKNPRYDLIIFDWNGTLSTANLPLAHYGESMPVPALFPGVKSVLKALYDDGYILAVASAASSRKLQFEAAQHEIDPYFALLQGGDQLYTKPDPDMLWGIMLKVGVEPERSLMIGDTETDMEMAKAAGIDRIAACYGHGTKEQLLKYQPVACLNSISELLGCLKA